MSLPKDQDIHNKEYGLNVNRYLLLIAGQVVITTIILFYILNNIIHRPVIVTGFDKFGIKEIYPTKNGEVVYEYADPNNDPRTLNTPKMTLNEDGSWKVAFDNTNKPQQLVVPIQYTGTCCQDEVRYSLHLQVTMLIK